MYKDLEKIPPIESLFHWNIEAGARPYWVQYMVPFKLLLLLFWQIKKTFTPIKYRAEKVLRHPMIDHLIIKKYEGWKFLLRYKSKKNNLVLLLCFSFTCIFWQYTEHDMHLSTRRSNFYNMKSFPCYMKRDEIYHEEAPVLTGSAKFMNYFRPLIGSAWNKKRVIYDRNGAFWDTSYVVMEIRSEGVSGGDGGETRRFS